MKIGLAAFDLDGTLLTKNCSIEFLKFLLQKKKISLSQYLYLGGCYIHHKVFFTSYKNLNKRVFDTFFQGHPVNYFQDLIPLFLDEYLPELLFEPVYFLLRFLKKQNIEVMLLSNSPSFLVQEVGKRLGFDRAFGTSFILDDRCRAIDIAVTMDGEKKSEILQEMRYRLNADTVIAFSDGIFDLPLLAHADVPIVVRPDRKLKKIALKQKWRILCEKKLAFSEEHLIQFISDILT